MKSFPKISIVIPTLNASRYLEKCLKAIYRQKYPKTYLEVMIVDNYSTDKTLEIARKYPVRILMNKIKDAQSSKMVGFKKATGKYFIYLDSDVYLVGNTWFTKMLKPLQEDKVIVGSFTRVVSRPTDSPICRYFSYDPLQRDPIFQFFSPSPWSTVVESREGYKVCQYNEQKITPAGLCLFRMDKLREVWDPKKDKKYMELDSLMRLVKAGYRRFAFVPDAGIHHPFLDDLSHLLRKRLKHIRKNYLGQPTPREYLWVDMRTLSGKLKVLTWVVYANLIIPATIMGLYKSIKHRDLVCMYEPIVAFAETWVIIYGFIRYSLF